MKKVRCAIYTRKSSEEGLEQDFNSLDAQREACAAYVLSQASEGWSLLPEHYDDGGLSGGSLDRPALQRLLADIATGKIDIIVVYKVDRLTRSLLDFAKLVEAFDKAEASFVSVTQSFNTTTSMGRLTLNMLLSFAQFEREVTAERIRDKIAASKARGMWMGGTPPLGYRPNGRSLAIVEEHAELIRDIYQRYLALGCVRTVAEQLAREGIRSPQRISGKGRKFGGCHLSRGQLYAILKNPVYVGGVVHRGQTYAGQQPAIIDRATWTEVQRRLADNLRGARRARIASPSLLAGLIVDEAEEPLVAVHACKGKVRYRYYVSRSLQHGAAKEAKAGIRLPAREVELLVTEQVADLVDNPRLLAERCGVRLTPDLIRATADRAKIVADQLRRGARGRLSELVAHVRICSGQIETTVRPKAVADVLGLAPGEAVLPPIVLTTATRLMRRGGAIRLVEPSSYDLRRAPNEALVKLIVKARKWWGTLSEGEIDVSALAKREGVTPSYVTRVVRLAFLAPAFVDAIVEGRHRSDVSAGCLTATGAVAMFWQQRMPQFSH